MKATSPMLRFGAQWIDAAGTKHADRNWKSKENGGCHVAKQGEIYPFGYDPTFYPHRLEEPYKVTAPSKIFVVDTGDLFGGWVPKAWIEKVLTVIKECDWHTFILLTKNPEGYGTIHYPENAWLGTSVNSDADAGRATAMIPVRAAIKYLSIEPLLGQITFPLDAFDWIIVGAQTGKNAPVPQKSWADKILREAEKKRIFRFVKSNLRSYYPDLDYKEFPA
jgi:protein gp37